MKSYKSSGTTQWLPAGVHTGTVSSFTDNALVCETQPDHKGMVKYHHADDAIGNGARWDGSINDPVEFASPQEMLTIKQQIKSALAAGQAVHVQFRITSSPNPKYDPNRVGSRPQTDNIDLIRVLNPQPGSTQVAQAVPAVVPAQHTLTPPPQAT
tara:strand:+ start:612 stop:1076 length:465 start_codon:yes stop_codon:yes gene_type:complete